MGKTQSGIRLRRAILVVFGAGLCRMDLRLRRGDFLAYWAGRAGGFTSGDTGVSGIWFLSHESLLV